MFMPEVTVQGKATNLHWMQIEDIKKAARDSDTETANCYRNKNNEVDFFFYVSLS